MRRGSRSLTRRAQIAVDWLLLVARTLRRSSPGPDQDEWRPIIKDACTLPGLHCCPAAGTRLPFVTLQLDASVGTHIPVTEHSAKENDLRLPQCLGLVHAGLARGDSKSRAGCPDRRAFLSQCGPVVCLGLFLHFRSFAEHQHPARSDADTCTECPGRR
jgi:hypothetical protein